MSTTKKHGSLCIAVAHLMHFNRHKKIIPNIDQWTTTARAHGLDFDKADLEANSLIIEEVKQLVKSSNRYSLDTASSCPELTLVLECFEKLWEE